MNISNNHLVIMAGGIGSVMKTCWFDRERKGNTKGKDVDYVVNNLVEIAKRF